MRYREKADGTNIGSEIPGQLTRHQKSRFSKFKDKGHTRSSQCKKCKYDYMLFAEKGICLSCLQRPEYENRLNKPHPKLPAKQKEDKYAVR
jgi:hypothetical protein